MMHHPMHSMMMGGMHPMMRGMHPMMGGMHPMMMGMGGMGMGMHPGMMGGLNQQTGYDEEGDDRGSGSDDEDHRRRMLNAVRNKKVVVPESEYKIIQKCAAIRDRDICLTYFYTDQSIAIDVYALGERVSKQQS